jgi:hypothetical protein
MGESKKGVLENVDVCVSRGSFFSPVLFDSLSAFIASSTSLLPSSRSHISNYQDLGAVAAGRSPASQLPSQRDSGASAFPTVAQSIAFAGPMTIRLFGISPMALHPVR